MQEISNELEFHSANFENVSLIGDFISEMTDTDMKSFLQLWRSRIGYAPTVKSHRILLLNRQTQEIKMPNRYRHYLKLFLVIRKGRF